jgi:uncharacterized protein YdiU (UPF0061 family)
MKFNFDNTYLQLPKELYSVCHPTPVNSPNVMLINKTLSRELDIDIDNCTEEDLANIFDGNKLTEDGANTAQAYSGHQFGHFTRLGDGRAILVGEQINKNYQRFDIQLKGAGVTPYSRRGDGRATLKAMLREYLISESLHSLRIPTTRSLAVVATGEVVYREQIEAGAILTRIASSHIRVGTFEHIARFCSIETLQTFTDYCIQRHYSQLSTTENPILEFLESVMENQIDLIINWMRVGFIHGVMNTDNMTISGESIDYGPCAFMNNFDPAKVYSSIDRDGRYAFGNQPNIALWNLTRFAETLLNLIDKEHNTAIEKAQNILDKFQNIFNKKHSTMICQKIGLASTEEADIELANKLLDWMYRNKADYTNTFIEIMYPGLLNNPIYKQTEFADWLNERENRLKENNISSDESLVIMQRNNPIYIPRNKQVETLLNQASQTRNMQKFEQYLELLSKPYCTTVFKTEIMEGEITQDDTDYKTYCGT